MRAVGEYGKPLVDDPGRLDDVIGLGVDEQRGSKPAVRGARGSPLASLTSPRAGRRGCWMWWLARTDKAYADWIAEREQARCERICVATLDPFRGYAGPGGPGRGLDASQPAIADGISEHIGKARAAALRDDPIPGRGANWWRGTWVEAA